MREEGFVRGAGELLDDLDAVCAFGEGRDGGVRWVLARGVGRFAVVGGGVGVAVGVVGGAAGGGHGVAVCVEAGCSGCGGDIRGVGVSTGAR